MTEPRPVPAAKPPMTYLTGVIRNTVGRPGAMVGLVWLALVSLCAVFAPLLASSFPLVVVWADGSWSSPWLRHLGPADVFLPVLAVFVLVMLATFGRRWSAGRRLGAVGLAIAVVVPLCYLSVSPPETRVYDTWREADRRGEIDFALTVPIPYSPSDRLKDMPDRKLRAPGWAHPLGTTVNNADLAARMIHACRIVMSIGFIATGIAVVLGVIIGGLMGYFSKLFDLLGMRLVEIFEAIPQLYLLLTFVAFFPRNAYFLYLMMVVIGLVSWTGYARFTRAEFLRLRAADYVTATRALGLPLRSTLFRHMLPNGIAPVLVTASFGIASAILLETFLSFLGLGLIDEPSWGQLLSQAVGAGGGFNWWIALFPGLAIFLTVFAYNLIGESLRDAIDPHVG